MSPEELKRQVEERLKTLDAQTTFDWAEYFEPLMTDVETLLRASDPTPEGPFQTHRVRGARYIRQAKALVATATKPINKFILQRQAQINDQTLVVVAGLLRRLAWLGQRWQRQESELTALRAEVAALKARLDAQGTASSR